MKRHITRIHKVSAVPKRGHEEGMEDSLEDGSLSDQRLTVNLNQNWHQHSFPMMMMNLTSLKLHCWKRKRTLLKE